MSNLNKLIGEKFKTDAAFGMAMGWTPQKVSRLKSGRYIPKFSDAVKMSRVLGIPLVELANFFTH